jgi:hypothetical protein
MIKPLDFQDQRHLEAVQGWFGLSNHLEANEELENITAENRDHPAVLEVRWQIYAKAKKWEAALEIAPVLVQLVPESPLGWVYRSYCLHERKRPNLSYNRHTEALLADEGSGGRSAALRAKRCPHACCDESNRPVRDGAGEGNRTTSLQQLA